MEMSEKGKTKISVIIPAHNEEKVIGETLSSILNSNNGLSSNLEIIVGCDNCSDNTDKISRKLGARVFNYSVKNQAKVANLASKKAKGDILLFLDADTLLSPNVLTEVRNSFEDPRVVGGRAYIKWESEGNFFDKLMAKIYSSALKFHKFKWGGFCFVKKDIFKKVGGYRDDYVYGFDFTLAKDVSKHGKIVLLPNCYVTTSGRRFDEEGWIKHTFLTPLRYFSGLKKRSEINYKDVR